jgi:predicted Zn-dependent protease
MKFAVAVNHSINEAQARTANGMLARATSASAVLDFFGKAGSSRGTALVRDFSAALAEDENLAIRALLWTRDIRGGAGERQQFRDLLSSLEAYNPSLVKSCIVQFLGFVP